MIDLRPAAEKYLETKKRIYPCHVNRISRMGHPCLRYLYHCRADWDKAALPDTPLQGTFETGKMLESYITTIFNMEIGPNHEPPLRIVGTQTSTQTDSFLAKHQISGTLDGFLQENREGQWVTLGAIDLKTCSPNVFPQYTTLESLNMYPWSAKYPAQVMLYSLASNLDKCYLLFVSKQNLYNQKILDFDLDWDYAEQLIRRADEVNQALQDKRPPEKINRPDLCSRCEFKTICMPDLKLGADTQVVNDKDFIRQLDRLEELAESRTLYNRLAKAIDERLVKGQTVIAGSWTITWRQARNGVWRKTIRKHTDE